MADAQATTPSPQQSQPQAQSQTQAQPQSALSAFSDELASVVERAASSIVTVAARPRQSASGIIWRTETETVVLTADHVVEREDDINVTLPDGRKVKAQLVGRDPGTDLAVLRLPGTELGTATAAETAEAARVGSLVLAIGRPTEGGPRVSFGAVSSVEGPHRSWQGSEIENIIFADVTLYPGFSGGPLVDLAGRVVGLNTSHLTRQSSTALPVVTLRRVANTLVKHGKVKRGYLGIGTQQVPLPAALAQKAGVTQDAALLIATIEAGSPAEKAGLLIGDLLVALGGQSVTDAETLRAQLGGDKLGQTITAKIVRGGEPTEVAVVIGERA